MNQKEKLACLSEQEVIRIFEARNVDLKLSFFETQFERFKEYCFQKCINRKVILEDVTILNIF